MKSGDLSEQFVSGEELFRGKFLRLRRDVVRLPDGSRTAREYVRHPGAVAMVALTAAGEVVLERQHRYPLGRDFVEIPAGKVDTGEQRLDTAKRELREETGYSAGEWSRLGVIHNAIGYSDEAIEIWRATGLRCGEAKPEAGEFLEVFTLPFEQALAMAADGRISDAKTIIGLYWAARRR